MDLSRYLLIIFAVVHSFFFNYHQHHVTLDTPVIVMTPSNYCITTGLYTALKNHLPIVYPAIYPYTRIVYNNGVPWRCYIDDVKVTHG